MPTRLHRTALAACATAVLALAATAANAASYSILYSFGGGADGSTPGEILLDPATGTLYGTTVQGGSAGFGTVFKVAANGAETVLYNFTGGLDGRNPSGRLARDAAGNLYGTAAGGNNNDGVVFKVAPGGAETVLYAFSGGADGANPVGGVLRNGSGVLFGTTFGGGSHFSGTLFKLTPTGHETVVHALLGAPSDDCGPPGGLIADAAGCMYGVTAGCPSSATDSPTDGSVFIADRTGGFQVIHAFGGGADGIAPSGTLAANATRTVMYGASARGGFGDAGTIYKLSRPSSTSTVWTETPVYSFMFGDLGGYPNGSLVITPLGLLYGTTSAGGTHGKGTVFRFTQGGSYSVLHSFAGGAGDGDTPLAGLVQGNGGWLYGTTTSGGSAGAGTVFKLRP